MKSSGFLSNKPINTLKVVTDELIKMILSDKTDLAKKEMG
jgi:hypothetical protein